MHDEPIRLFTFERAPATPDIHSLDHAADALDDTSTVWSGDVAFNHLELLERPPDGAAVMFNLVPAPGLPVPGDAALRGIFAGRRLNFRCRRQARGRSRCPAVPLSR